MDGRTDCQDRPKDTRVLLERREDATKNNQMAFSPGKKSHSRFAVVVVVVVFVVVFVVVVVVDDIPRRNRIDDRFAVLESFTAATI